MPIPLMDDAEMEEAARRNVSFQGYVRDRRWTFEQTLRVLGNFLYWTPSIARMEKAADWLQEFVDDLREKIAEMKRKRAKGVRRVRRS